jgi:hypothetical protein
MNTTFQTSSGRNATLKLLSCGWCHMNACYLLSATQKYHMNAIYNIAKFIILAGEKTTISNRITCSVEEKNW